MTEVTSDDDDDARTVSTIPHLGNANYAEIRDGIYNWLPTPQQVREIVLTEGLRGMMPDRVRPEHQKHIPDVETIGIASLLARRAIEGGRLIDFGEWTNEAIINGSSRGGPMWEAGGLPSPFAETFIFMHTWTLVAGGFTHKAAGVYLVAPVTDDTPCEFDITELQPVVLAGERRLTYGDRCLMVPSRSNVHGYDAMVQPNIWRFMDGYSQMNATPLNMEQSAASAAASNVCDPLITALLILNTRGVGRQTIRASEKLLRARSRSGKPPIPSYDVVDSAMYITALSRVKREATEHGGGRHRSPIPHVRLGHMREYPGGRAAVIPSTLVNVPPEARAAFKSSRSHYVFKEKT